MAKKKKLPTFSSLEKKLDSLLSKYIRLKDADEGGTVRCVTCRKLLHWAEAQCGHWVKRQHRAVRWDERNVAVQCRRCNHFLDGAQDEFAQHILDSYGQTALNELLQKKRQVAKFSRALMNEWIEFYKGRLEALDA